MRDFFVPKVARLVLIDQVYPGSDFVLPRIEMYEKNRPVRLLRTPVFMYVLYPLLLLTNRSGTQVMFKVRDFISVLLEGQRAKQSFDIFIGFEAINALSGIFLRKLGKVRCVVYYVSDYSPSRYKNKWFNSVYLWLDRQAATHADMIWDVSKAMMPARIKAGLNPTHAAPVMHVPNALYPAQIRALPESEINKNSVVFLGTLGYENGPDIAVKAMDLVLKKVPTAMMHIIGGDEPNEERLKELTRSLGISSHVIFHGFINTREEISALARTCQVSVAPYKYIRGSARLYGDATKIRAYVAAGLPVITTRVPPLGKEIEAFGAGLVVDDTPEAFADAIISIFRDRDKYTFMRHKAILFAKQNTWEHEFAKALVAMKKQMLV